METFKYKDTDDDESLVLTYKDKVIFETNHDEVGWNGIMALDLLIITINNIIEEEQNYEKRIRG